MLDLNDIQHEGAKPQVTLVRKDIFTNLASIPVSNLYQFPEVGGSREHFFHFLLGYLLPVVHEQRIRGLSHFGVLDCGPLMTPILTSTLSRLELSFEVTRNERTTSYVVVPPWDTQWGFTHYITNIHTAAQIVKDKWSNGIHECPAESCPETSTILLARSPSHSFYKGNGKAEIPSYGLDRRGVINWPEVSQFLTEKGINSDLYEPGTHSLSCQINVFRKARTIVGMRGAEFANLVWAESKPQIMVFNPYKDEGPIPYMSRSLGIRHHTVPVTETHFRARADMVAQFILKNLETSF